MNFHININPKRSNTNSNTFPLRTSGHQDRLNQDSHWSPYKIRSRVIKNHENLVYLSFSDQMQ